MIFKGRLPSSPTIRFIVDGVDLDYLTVQMLELSMDENMHDSAVATIAGLSPKLVTDMIGRPVSMTWEYGTLSHVFTGYVHNTVPTGKAKQGLVNNSPFQTAKVVCLGASSHMKGNKVRSWQNLTLPMLVQQLSRTYQFTYSVPKSTTVFPQLLQSGKTDWEFLVGVAGFLGFSVTMHGTHLTIWDRARYLARRSYYGEVNTARTALGRTYEAPGRLLEITGDFKQPDNTSASGIDPFGQSTGTIGPFALNTGAGRVVTNRYVNELPVSTPSVELADIAVSRNQSFPFSVQVVTSGMTGCIPGGIINIVDSDSYFDGLWCVTGVTQTANRDRYITKITAVKDSTNEDPVTLPPAQKFAEPPSPVLLGGSWASSKQLEETYA